MVEDAREKVIDRLAILLSEGGWFNPIARWQRSPLKSHPVEGVIDRLVRETPAADLEVLRIQATQLLDTLGLVAVDRKLVMAVRDADATLAAAVARQAGPQEFAAHDWDRATEEARIVLADAVLAQVPQ